MHTHARAHTCTYTYTICARRLPSGVRVHAHSGGASHPVYAHATWTRAHTCSPRVSAAAPTPTPGGRLSRGLSRCVTRVREQCHTSSRRSAQISLSSTKDFEGIPCSERTIGLFARVSDLVRDDRFATNKQIFGGFYSMRSIPKAKISSSIVVYWSGYLNHLRVRALNRSRLSCSVCLQTEELTGKDQYRIQP